MFICHTRPGHVDQKHIYGKASKVRFISKHKWTRPFVNIVWQEKQQESHLILERLLKA